ncbi:MAG: PilZ domain-containing protein [Lachnospiraceae bacterium]|nr:PilZ domain-containing protein [Lachnospiraceae bacterium]
MVNEGELKNRRILIKNAEDGMTIADTSILRFNGKSNSVMIHADSLPEKKFYNISAIVFAGKALYEFGGSIRGAVVENEIEVFLGKSKEKESRTRIRYPIAMEGNIKGVYIDEKEISLKKSILIRTVNMSASGVLLKADVGCFNVGEIFSLVLRVREGVLKMQCEVVRIQKANPSLLEDGEDYTLMEEYGCRIKETRFDPVKREGERWTPRI